MSNLPSIGPVLFGILGLTILLTWLFTTSPPSVRAVLVVGFYLAFGTLASALYTRNLIWLALSLNSNAGEIPARYMVLSGAVLVYVAVLIILRSRLRDPRLQAVCLLLLFARGMSHNFHQPPYGDFAWKTMYPKIAVWRAAWAEGKQKPLGMPIAPAPWTIDLP